MTFFPWDEINALEAKAETAQTRYQNGDKDAVGSFIDEVTELFEMDYMLGVQDASMQIGRSIDPDYRQLADALTEKIDGKDYTERITDYIKGGTPYDIARVVATDAHRIYNRAMFDGAKKGGATKKTWNCMMLPTSRDTHIYLDGTTVDIDAEFYSFRGGSTLYPGQWGIAEEDINCLCSLTFS